MQIISKTHYVLVSIHNLHEFKSENPLSEPQVTTVLEYFNQWKVRGMGFTINFSFPRCFTEEAANVCAIL